MDSPLISFLIVNYKVGDLVEQAIKSIEAKVSTNYEIIVLDNASEDGSVEKLTGKFEHTTVIASSENLGFGAGNNVAYTYSKGDYIFLLNPDTLIIDDSVDRMVQYLKAHPNVGLVSPKLLYEDRTLQRSIRKFYSYFGSLIDNRFMNPVIARFPGITNVLPGLVDHSKTQQVDWAKGAALLIKKMVIKEIGLFDEQFWIYGEEMDLCYRIGQSGWVKMYLHDCQIVHLEGKSTVQSSVKMFLMNYKGMYLFLMKHFSPSTLKRYHQRVGVFSRLIYAISFNNPSKRELYKRLIMWHKIDAKKLITG